MNYKIGKIHNQSNEKRFDLNKVYKYDDGDLIIYTDYYINSYIFESLNKPMKYSIPIRRADWVQTITEKELKLTLISKIK